MNRQALTHAYTHTHVDDGFFIIISAKRNYNVEFCPLSSTSSLHSSTLAYWLYAAVASFSFSLLLFNICIYIYTLFESSAIYVCTTHVHIYKYIYVGSCLGRSSCYAVRLNSTRCDEVSWQAHIQLQTFTCIYVYTAHAMMMMMMIGVYTLF